MNGILRANETGEEVKDFSRNFSKPVTKGSSYSYRSLLSESLNMHLPPMIPFLARIIHSGKLPVSLPNIRLTMQRLAGRR
jgi:hypothetical protein